MIATWMLSALLFTALLGAAALCAESALRAAGRPTRWPWLVALVASVSWPLFAPLARRSDALESVAITLPTIQVVPDQLPATMPWTHWIDVVLLTLWAVSSERLPSSLRSLRVGQRRCGQTEHTDPSVTRIM